MKNFTLKNTTIAVIGSHSALDVCRGAKDEGFKTLVIAEKGREKTYNQYYETRDGKGCVDECIVLDHFADIMDIQDHLQKRNVIFVPNRSFEAYLSFDYEKIEKQFVVPMFGNRYLLKIEERGKRPNQYDLLTKAKIRFPIQFEKYEQIDRLCLVKVQEAKRKFERAFFFAKNPADYLNKAKKLLVEKKISEEGLSNAVIEEYVAGVHVNFNFFYSSLTKELELLGTDTRRQTNIEGLTHLPSFLQEDLQDMQIQFEEASHTAVTVLESMLEQAFALGEQFVKASEALFAPGIIGPFALQSIIIPGPPKKDIVVIDVSPRMPGSPGIAATPYSGYLYGSSVSVGRRVAKEIKLAMKTKRLDQILS